MAIQNYLYNLQTGQTLIKNQNQSQTQSTTVETGTVDQLSIAQIKEQFMTGNMELSEVLKGLKANGINPVYSNNGTMLTITFVLDGKPNRISCNSAAAQSQTDNKTSNVYTKSELKLQLGSITDEFLNKYFVAAEQTLKNGQMTVVNYAVKSDCGCATLDDVIKIKKNEMDKMRDSIVLNNFLNDVNKQGNGRYELDRVDGTMLSWTNYAEFSDKIKVATGEEVEKIKTQALKKFVEDFSSGNLSSSDVLYVLDAIGVENYQRKSNTRRDIQITFTYNNKNYTVTCQSTAALKGSDDKTVETFNVNDLKNTHNLTDAEIAKYFTAVASVDGQGEVYKINTSAGFSTIEDIVSETLKGKYELYQSLDDLKSSQYAQYSAFFVAVGNNMCGLNPNYTMADLQEAMDLEGVYTPYQLETNRFVNNGGVSVLNSISTGGFDQLEFDIAEANGGVKTTTKEYLNEISYTEVGGVLPPGYTEVGRNRYYGGQVVMINEKPIYVELGMTLEIITGKNESGETCEILVKSGKSVEDLEAGNFNYNNGKISSYVLLDNKIVISSSYAAQLKPNQVSVSFDDPNGNGVYSISRDFSGNIIAYYDGFNGAHNRIEVVVADNLTSANSSILREGETRNSHSTETVTKTETKITMPKEQLNSLVTAKLEETIEGLNTLLNSNGISQAEYNQLYAQKMMLEQELNRRILPNEIGEVYTKLNGSLDESAVSQLAEWYSNSGNIQDSFYYIINESVDDPAEIFTFAKSMLIYKDSYYLSTEQIAIFEKLAEKISNISAGTDGDYKSTAEYAEFKAYYDSAEVQDMFKQFMNNYDIAVNGESSLAVNGDIYNSLQAEFNEKYPNLGEAAFEKLFNSAKLTTESAFGGYGTFSQANAFYQMMDYGADLVNLFVTEFGMSAADAMNHESFGVLMMSMFNSKEPDAYIAELTTIFKNENPTLEELMSIDGPLYKASENNTKLIVFKTTIDTKVEQERIFGLMDNQEFLDFISSEDTWKNIDLNSDNPFQDLYNIMLEKFKWSESDTLTILSLVLQSVLAELEAEVNGEQVAETEEPQESRTNPRRGIFSDDSNEKDTSSVNFVLPTLDLLTNPMGNVLPTFIKWAEGKNFEEGDVSDLVGKGWKGIWKGIGHAISIYSIYQEGKSMVYNLKDDNLGLAYLDFMQLLSNAIPYGGTLYTTVTDYALSKVDKEEVDQLITKQMRYAPAAGCGANSCMAVNPW